MIPSYGQSIRGKKYRIKIGDTVIQMRRSNQMYTITVGYSSVSYMHYDEAVDYLIHSIVLAGGNSNVRK